VRGLALGLGIAPSEVQSPTYTLVREHAGSPPLVHLDLYRLEPGEVAAEGFEELLLGPGVKAVEWAERLPFAVPGAIAVAIRRRQGDAREIRVVDPGRLAAESDERAERAAGAPPDIRN